jgi:hypothetical protein
MCDVLALGMCDASFIEGFQKSVFHIIVYVIGAT